MQHILNITSCELKVKDKQVPWCLGEPPIWRTYLTGIVYSLLEVSFLASHKLVFIILCLGLDWVLAAALAKRHRSSVMKRKHHKAHVICYF